MVLMTPGDIIRSALKKAGKTQEWLAGELEVTQSAVSAYLRNPTVKTLQKINAVLPIPELRPFLVPNEERPPLDAVASEALATLPEDLKELLRVNFDDPDLRASFEDLRWLYTEAPDEFRRVFLDLLAVKRKSLAESKD